jgi:dTDP-4-dehydrorhamnose reductase
MRTIITGADGQLGQALYKVLSERGFDILDIPNYPDFDIADHAAVPMLAEMYPELVIHCGAMTNVDACAKDPDEAFRVNAFGTQNVAHACLRCNAEMVYISTNEVFSGQSDRPYTEIDPPQPINPYGSSKRAGEQMAAKYLPTGLYIVRTAWLYGGGNMFPEKIIAAADKNGQLSVVTDEISNPTYAADLAKAVVQLAQTREYGTYHFVNAGYCSRYDYAKEILRLSGRENVPIQPITLADYPRPSVVPPFAPLENSRGIGLGITFRSWQEALQEYFEQK